MSTLSVRVSEDPTRPMGQAIVSVGGLPRPLEAFEFALSRHDLAASYLGLEGWRGAECWLRPEEAWYSGDILKFVMAPDLVFQLENRSYRLALRGQGLADVAATTFVWPLELEQEECIHASAEPTNATLPTRLTPSRREAEEHLPTRIATVGARPSRPTRVVAVDTEPTCEVPGRRIPSTGNGDRKAGGHAALLLATRPGPSRAAPTPAVSQSEAGRGTPRSDLAGADEQRRRRSGVLWIGLVVFVVAAAAAATGWWWRGHPPAETPIASEPALLEAPPDVRSSIWLKTAPEPVPAPASRSTAPVRAATYE